MTFSICRKTALGLIAITLSALCSLDAKVDAVFSEQPEPPPSPWFTGPLLAPSGHTVPGGRINIEPYAFVTYVDKVYNKHWKSLPTHNKLLSINFPVPIQIGINRWIDVVFTPQGYYNRVKKISSTEFGDLSFGFDFQLYKRPDDGWWPSVKLSTTLNAPTGKYQHGSPHKRGTDLVGSGSWAPTATLVFARLFHIECQHYLATRLAFGYTVHPSVHVHGLNSYGGGFGTNGTVHPGDIFNVVLGLEYSLTRNWVLALDIQETHNNKTRFSGARGITTAGAVATVGRPSSEQISLAPAIEYNWSSHVGLIAGAWFTVAGRNSTNFVSGVVALNLYL